jgi:hypothetical protein
MNVIATELMKLNSRYPTVDVWCRTNTATAGVDVEPTGLLLLGLAVVLVLLAMLLGDDIIDDVVDTSGMDGCDTFTFDVIAENRDDCETGLDTISC